MDNQIHKISVAFKLLLFPTKTQNCLCARQRERENNAVNSNNYVPHGLRQEQLVIPGKMESLILILWHIFKKS